MLFLTEPRVVSFASILAINKSNLPSILANFVSFLASDAWILASISSLVISATSLALVSFVSVVRSNFRIAPSAAVPVIDAGGGVAPTPLGEAGFPADPVTLVCNLGTTLLRYSGG